MADDDPGGDDDDNPSLPDGGNRPDGSTPGEPDGGGGGLPDGGPPGCSATCEVSFSYPAQGVTTGVALRGSFAADGWSTGLAMTLDGDQYKASLSLPHGRAVQYKFVVDGTNWIKDPAAPFEVGDGFGGKNSAVIADCGCAPLEFDWRDAVMYFVLVDRFYNGDAANDAPLPNLEGPANYQGGDFAGLQKVIESGYFEQIGVNVLWISAPVDNADGAGIGDDGHNYSGYHGYWPKDLGAVESKQGDMAALQAVVDAAHRRGIRVVMDYVMNHVHAESPTYVQHKDWFWANQNGGQNCVCGSGCSWDPPEGVRCWFRDYLPDFNFQVKAARDFSVGNAVEWIQKVGLDGYRLDAVKHIEFSWLTDLRARVAAEVEFGPRKYYMVGETYTGDKGLIKAYVNPSTMLDGQFDFPLRAEAMRVLLGRKGSMNDLASFLNANDGFYGQGAIMGTFIGNHDLPRVIHLAEDQPQFGEWDSGKSRAWNNKPGQPASKNAYERVALGFALIATLPGIPLVYYGDEIGLAGGGDPDNRRFMTWEGLSANQLWLRERLAHLLEIRAAHPALRRGTRSAVGASNDVLVYKMAGEGQTIFVALNRADGASAAPSLPAGSYKDLVTDTVVTAPLQVPARSAMILLPQ